MEHNTERCCDNEVHFPQWCLNGFFLVVESEVWTDPRHLGAEERSGESPSGRIGFSPIHSGDY